MSDRHAFSILQSMIVRTCGAKRTTRRPRLRLEALEDKSVPSITLADEGAFGPAQASDLPDERPTPRDSSNPAIDVEGSFDSISGSGGPEGTTRSLKMGSKGGGTIEYTYDHYGIPDNFIIRYEGKNLLETGFVSGYNSGTVRVPKGNSDTVEIVVATNNSGTAWEFTAASKDCPDTAPFVVQPSGGDFNHSTDPSGNPVCTANGTIFIGRKDGISQMLKIEGTVEIKKDSMKINGTIYSMIGPAGVTSKPLFKGNFEMPYKSGKAEHFVEIPGGPEEFQLGGMDVDFSGITVDPNALRLGGKYKILEDVGFPDHVFSGPDGLNIYQSTADLGSSFKYSTFNFKDFTLFKKLPVKNFSDFSVEWIASQNAVKIQGKIEFDLKSKARIGKVVVDLAGENYIQIKEGKWDVKGEMSAETDLKFPPKGWGLKEFKLMIDTITKDVKGSAQVTLPIGRTVKVTGTVGFKTTIPPLELNYVGLKVDNLNMPIPAYPTVFFQGFDGSVENFAESDTDPIEFTGHVSATLGPQILGASAMRLDVGGKVSAEHLQGDGTLTILNDKVFKGTVTADLNWEKKTFEATGNYNLFDGMLQVNTSLKPNSNFDVAMSGKATIGVPKSVPFWGGYQIASGDYIVDFTNDGNYTNDYVAGWGTIRIQKVGLDLSFVGGVKAYFNGRLEPIGSKNIPSLPAPGFAADGPGKAGPGRNFSVPAATDYLLLSADWDNDVAGNVPARVHKPGGTLIEEADFEANGIYVVDELTDANTKVVLIDHPEAGDWHIEVADDTDLENVTYSASVPTIAPTVTVTEPAADVPGGSDVDIAFTANDPDSDAEVRLFYDSDNTGFDGVPIARELVEEDGAGTYSWNTQGLAPGNYYVYAMVLDGDNPPAFSYAPGKVQIADSADLAVTHTVSPDPILVGDDVTHTFTVTNNGPSASTNVTATATLASEQIDSAAETAYTAATITPTFEDISTTGTLVLANLDEGSTSVNMPFTFKYYGVDYTTAYITTNGLVSFGTAASGYVNGDLTTAPTPPTIAALWDDLATSAGGVRYEVRGTAGQRRLIVQWHNAAYYSGTPTLQFQAVLFEGSNQIQFNYANLTTGYTGRDGGASATVGLKGGTGTTPLLLAFNNGPNTFVGTNKSTLLRLPPASKDYEVSLEAGDSVMFATNTPDESLDPALELFGPGGASLGTNDNGAADGRNARLTHAITQAGVYTVRVSGAGDTTGAFSLDTAVNTATIASGAAKTFQIVRVAPETPGVLESHFEARGDVYDPVATNDADDRNVGVSEPRAGVTLNDLAVFVSQTPSPVLKQNFTYQLTVKNNGSFPATNVVLTENVFSDLANFISATSSQGTTPTFGYPAGVTASLGTIAPGAIATVTITLNPFQAGDVITSTRVTASEPDPQTTDNYLANAFSVAPAPPTPADLSMSTTVSDTTPDIGDEITIGVRLTNSGPGIASGVVVKTLLPTADLKFVSATPEQGTYNQTTGIWTLGNVRDNLSRTLSLKAILLTARPITLTGEVKSVNESDPDSTAGNGVVTEDDYTKFVLTPNAARRDVYAADAGKKLTVAAGAGVMANDYKTPGKKWTAVKVGDTTRGTLALKPDGGFTYQPGETFAGVDSFTYKMVDNSTPPVESNIQTVTLSAQIVNFRSSAVSVSETAKKGSVTFDLRLAPETALSIPYTVVAKTAQAFGTDYTLASGTAVVAAKTKFQTINFNVTDDLIDEAAETFEIRFGTLPAGVTAGLKNVTTVSVTDNDAAPKVGFYYKALSGSEAAAGYTYLSLSRASGQQITVNYSLSAASTAKAPDHSFVNGTAIIPAGSTSYYLTWPVTNDLLDEKNETVVLSLSRPVNATIGAFTTPQPGYTSFTYTILDDDATPSVRFATGASTVNEGTVTLPVTVTLSSPSSLTATVKYKVTGGSATTGQDFSLAAGTVTFKPGETSKTFTVRVVNDRKDEIDETVVIGLNTPVNAVLGTITSHTVTIQDNDPAAPDIAPLDASAALSVLPARGTRRFGHW